MWINYFKCKLCGSVRQYGISTEKLPSREVPEINANPLLICNHYCSNEGMHTPHEFISSEVLIIRTGQGFEEAVISRCAELGFRKQEVEDNGKRDQLRRVHG